MLILGNRVSSYGIAGVIIIAVMGITGTGKSTFIQKITKKDVKIGEGTQSQTQDVDYYGTTIQGTEVWFIDTPGFDDSGRTDAQILEQIGSWLANAHRKNYKINGIIYLHRINDNRMKGSNLKNLRMFKKLVGMDYLKNVVLATTMWDCVSREEGDVREAELKRLYWDELSKFGMQVRRLDEDGKDLSIVSELMKNIDPQPLLIQKELVDEGKSLNQTSAGKEVLDEVIRATEELKAQLKEVTEELSEAKASGEKNMQDLRTVLEESENELRCNLERAELDRMALNNKLADFHEASLQKQEDLLREINTLKHNSSNETQRINEQWVAAEVKSQTANLENMILKDKLEREEAERNRLQDQLEYEEAERSRLEDQLKHKETERSRLEKVLKERDGGCHVF